MKTLSENNEALSSEQFAVQGEQAGAASQESLTGKKPFVEPQVSVPVNVLETTTFFQNQTESVVLP
jgi:hypothetical protein